MWLESVLDTSRIGCEVDGCVRKSRDSGFVWSVIADIGSPMRKLVALSVVNDVGL